MAAKIYKVVKDGEEINNVKNLVLAKKLADEEGGEVYSGGKCIYVGGENPANEDAAFPEKSTSDQAEIWAETLTPENPAPVQTQIRVETVTPEKYRLRSLMNVRKEPSMQADILGTKPAGTMVSVLEIKNDWLCLVDGTYILYGSGEFAEKEV